MGERGPGLELGRELELELKLEGGALAERIVVEDGT